ncbi:hypothetical protein GCM10009557_32450 [Virgisporangium ochraceum]
MKRRVLGAALLAPAMLLTACGSGEPAAAPRPHDGHTAHGSAPPPPPAPLRAGERFVELSMPEAYTPKAPRGGNDEYRCFLVDPGLTAGAYLMGSQFQPQNAAIVHHAIFFRIDPGDAGQARDVDTRDDGPGWTCFGNSGVGEEATWVPTWAPGGTETLLGDRLGYAMPAGSLLVMQVHYNLLGGGGSDRSGVRLRLSDGGPGFQALGSMRLAAPVELPCAAGETGDLCDRERAVADVTERFGRPAERVLSGLERLCGPPDPGGTQHCDRTVTRPGTVHALGGHMHLLGRSIRIELNPGTPGARTLLDVPAYDFDDQALRPLAEPLPLKAGDTLRVTCTHDASLRAQLPALKDTPPRYVVWGEGTADEMCLGLVVLTR